MDFFAKKVGEKLNSWLNFIFKVYPFKIRNFPS